LSLEFTEEFAAACVNDCYGNVGVLQSLTLKALDVMGIRETASNETV
jgi:hypothetical protein